jgi:uncharacterized membrane protein YkvI
LHSKLRKAGIVLIVLAVLSRIAEAVFYGDVGPDGVLQESLFLPLTFILLALGLVALAASVVARGGDG